MSFPRYPEYTATAVAAWFECTPRHWTTRRLKRVVRLLTEKTTDRSNVVALEHIEAWTGRVVPTDTEFEGDGISFAAGDVLFGKLRPYLAKVYHAQRSGQAIGDVFVMRPSVGLDGAFLKYVLLSKSFIDIVDGSTFGAKMPRASWDFTGDLPIPTPPPAEQHAVVAFLNRETARIDALVAWQRPARISTRSTR